MIAKIMIAKSKSKAILTNGPIAFPIADITTCRPEIEEIWKLNLVFTKFSHCLAGKFLNFNTVLLILFSYMWKLFLIISSIPEINGKSTKQGQLLQNTAPLCGNFGYLLSLFFYKKIREINTLRTYLNYMVFSRNIFQLWVNFMFFHTVYTTVSVHIHCINISWLLQMNI